MEGRIKSAYEKAMERAESFRKVSPEEIERIEYKPRGMSIGSRFMNNVDFDIDEALEEFPLSITKYVLEGFQEVLLMNVTLPADESAIKLSRRALEGILFVKQDKVKATKVIAELDYLLEYYSQALEQTKEKFKSESELRGRTNNRDGARSRDAEMSQELRMEWASVFEQLNTSFEANLVELKDSLKKIF